MRWTTRSLAVAAVACGLGGATGGLRAQDTEALRTHYQIAIPQWLEWYQASLRSAPAAGASSPAAFGAAFGDFFAGAGYQATVRVNNASDGAVVGGFGLGNPTRAVGLEVAVTSYSTVRSGFGKTMAASFKVHRMLPGLLSVGVGVENVVHSKRADGGQSLYGVVSKVFPLTPDAGRPFSAVTASVGAGNGRFRSFDDMAQDRETIGAFGSVGVRVLPAASVIADWNGQDLTAALSLAPLAHVPLVITPAFTDLTGQAIGNRARFVLGVGGGIHVDF